MRCTWKKTDNPAYNRLMKQFEDRVAKYARGGSYETRRVRFRKYKAFIKFVAERFAPEDIINFQPRHVAAYIGYRKEGGIAETTILNDLSIIRWWHEQMPLRRFDMPDNNMLFELEARLNDKAFCHEFKERFKRKDRPKRCLQKLRNTV